VPGVSRLMFHESAALHAGTVEHVLGPDVLLICHGNGRRARHEYQEPSDGGKTCVKVIVYRHEWKEGRHESQSPSFGWRAGRQFVTLATTTEELL
jgi:hypothetical protein